MPIEMEGETYLSANETSKKIGVSRETLNRYVNQGLISRYKKGLTRNTYYKLSDVEDLIKKRSTMNEIGG
jgi:predicted site-specific integrase-resolvase